MAKTNYLEDEIIKHIFRTGSFAKPTVLAVGLFTAAPSDAGGGTEVSGGSYARVQRDPLDANWTATAGGDGETDNAADLVFPTPTANWGTITHFGIFDATSVGNLLYWGALDNSKTVNNGDPAPKFVAGALTVSED
jgi:hypothetical protein